MGHKRKEIDNGITGLIWHPHLGSQTGEPEDGQAGGTTAESCHYFIPDSDCKQELGSCQPSSARCAVILDSKIISSLGRTIFSNSFLNYSARQHDAAKSIRLEISRAGWPSARSRSRRHRLLIQLEADIIGPHEVDRSRSPVYAGCHLSRGTNELDSTLAQ